MLNHNLCWKKTLYKCWTSRACK